MVFVNEEKPMEEQKRIEDLTEIVKSTHDFKQKSADEEARFITPAIDILRQDGLQISGPLPPDTMFSATARPTYDVAICMYHDQALIPIKTLDLSGGVNVTLGLPFVRTSPDHGTALDIAGKGVADETSMVAALRMAANIARVRGVAT